MYMCVSVALSSAESAWQIRMHIRAKLKSTFNRPMIRSVVSVAGNARHYRGNSLPRELETCALVVQYSTVMRCTFFVMHRKEDWVFRPFQRLSAAAGVSSRTAAHLPMHARRASHGH